MMNILCIVPNPPSLVRVRPYNLIRHLCARGHQLTVATVWSNEEERSDVEHLRTQEIEVMTASLQKGQVMRNLLRALATGAPLQAYYAYSPILAQKILHLLNPVQGQRFDLIHVEHLRGAQYGLAIRNPSLRPFDRLRTALGSVQAARLRTGSQLPIPIVWDSVDCITYLFEQALQMGPNLGSRLKAWLDLERTRRYEGWLVRQFDRVLVTSHADRQALQDLASRFMLHASRSVQPATLNPSTALRRGSGQGSGRRFEPKTIAVLPNGVDLDYFTPTDEPRQANTVIITGKMSYHANVTATLHLVNDIMPHVWAQRPDVKVWIVGKDPPREIRQSAIRNPRSAIRVTGTVPDIRPYLRRSAVAVAPIRYGAGIQNKVLEAMACATPVVASRQAVSALEAVNGEHLLVAEDAATFAQHIVDLLADQAWQCRLGTAGRRYVEQHHDWDRIAGRLEQIYTELRGVR